MFLQVECGVILLKTVFCLDCTDVFRSQNFMRSSDINHVVIQRTICAFCKLNSMRSLHTYTLFPRNILDMPCSDCASCPTLFMYTGIHMHAPIRLRRCIFRLHFVKPDLGMIEYLQIMISQVIFVALSASFHFYGVR